MRKADFTARIKKIEIVNRVLTGGWRQSIRVILEEIDLSDGNLLELKQFRPNEQVLVELSPVQVNLFDCIAGQYAVAGAATAATAGAAGVTATSGAAATAGAAAVTAVAESVGTAGLEGTVGTTETASSAVAAGQEHDREELAAPGPDDAAEFLSFSEGEIPLQANEQVVKAWRFCIP